MLNIYLNTWKNYNSNFVDGGQWIALPMEEEELERTMEAIAENIGETDPEFFINDFEWMTEIELKEIHECDSVFSLNDFVTELDNYGEYEQKEIAALMEALNLTFMEAIKKHKAGTFSFYDSMDMVEVAHELIKETLGDDPLLRDYFDYEGYADELAAGEYYETTYGVIVEG